MHAQTTTQERTRQTRCARVGIWQFRKLCLGLTKRYRPDKVWHADKLHLTRYDTTMRGEFDLPQYLSKTNASFLVGDVLNSMTGCNTLVSLHVLPGPHHTQDEIKSFTYVSHSIKEFFDNIRKVPEEFIESSAFHLCLDPQVQWSGHDEHFPTVHDHPDLFKPQHGSGPDALAKEIIANSTDGFSTYGSLLGLGDPISIGYKLCEQTRFDWEQDKQMHNLSKVIDSSGTNITKQWLSINNTDSITKLSMACNNAIGFTSGSRDLPEDKDADDASVALYSYQMPLQVIFALLFATLIVTCA